MVSEDPRHGHLNRELDPAAHGQLQEELPKPELGEVAALLQGLCTTSRGGKRRRKTVSGILKIKKQKKAGVDVEHLDPPLKLSKCVKKKDCLWKSSMATTIGPSRLLRRVFFEPLLSAISDSSMVRTMYSCRHESKNTASIFTEELKFIGGRSSAAPAWILPVCWRVLQLAVAP